VDTTTSLLFLPRETPTLLKLEAMCEEEKLVKDLALEDVPTESRFLTALRRIAFVVTSSSVADAPFPSSTCRPLRLTGVCESDVGDSSIGGRTGVKAAAASTALPGVTGDVTGGVETISVTTGCSVFIGVVGHLDTSAPEESGEGAMSG
jgi:hypothetical protein